ncbi:hypothetical protein L9F63_000089, partial [Diploptera punctata]
SRLWHCNIISKLTLQCSFVTFLWIIGRFHLVAKCYDKTCHFAIVSSDLGEIGFCYRFITALS